MSRNDLIVWAGIVIILAGMWAIYQPLAIAGLGITIVGAGIMMSRNENH